MEARLVLGVVAVEEESGLMGGAEERVGHNGATETVDHGSRLQVSAAHF